MAARNIEIVMTVRDNANKKLKDAERSIKRIEKAAKGANIDFKGFNRTLFATTALVGTFTAAFYKLGQSIDLGGELDRLDYQFENVLGSSGAFLKNIRSLTDASVDSMVALKAGIDLYNSGITEGQESTSKFIAMSAAAARKAGLDTSKGIKAMIDFAKKGSVSSLELLNLTRTTDAAFTSQLEAIKAAGGVFGGTLSIQQKYMIGMRLLQKATLNNMKGHEDLADVVKLVNTDFDFFRRTIGRFFGTALSPLLKSISDIVFNFSLFLEKTRKNNKEVLFLVKTFTVATVATIAFTGALIGLKLVTSALGSLGFGLPKLLLLVTGLGSTFLGLTHSADGVMEKFRLFGGVLKGIFQLVTNLDRNTGISKIDKGIRQLLEKHGLMGFVDTVSRVISVIKFAATDLINLFSSLAKSVDNITGKFTNLIFRVFGKWKGFKDMFWIDDSTESKLARIGVLASGIAAAFATWKIGGGFLKGLFGGFKRGNSRSNPLYVENVGFEVGSNIKETLNKGKSGVFGWIYKKLGLENIFKESSKISKTGSKLKFLTKALGKFGAKLGIIGVVVQSISTILEMLETSEIVKPLLKLIGGAAGSIGGGALGSLIGSAVAPGVGTVIGGLAGSTIGGFLGSSGTTSIYESATGIKTSQVNKPEIKTSQVNIPETKTSEDRMVILSRQMQEMNLAQRKQAQQDLTAAIAAGSPGGGQVTEEEFGRLHMAFKNALDESQALKGIKDNTRKDNIPLYLRRQD